MTEPATREPATSQPPSTYAVTDEDHKLVILARAARARAAAQTGAAVRDDTGRTYSAVPVELASFAVSALQLAVAQAVASGSTRLEAAAVVGVAQPADLDAVRDVGPAGTPVYIADTTGAVTNRMTA